MTHRTRRPLHRTLALAMLLAALVVTAGCERVGDWVDGECVEGQLDRPRFCDRDGDLVADRDPEGLRWLNPDTLIFAYTPVEDPAQYRQVWDEFLAHLEVQTGKEVQFFPVGSNAAQIEAMRAGRLHIAGFNTGSLPLAVNCAGFKPLAMMAAEDGSFGYEMELITHVDSGITTVDALKGRTLAFTSPTSNSGFKAPSALLGSEFDLQAGRDFEAAYSGRHDNSLLGVYNRDYDAAAVANVVTDRLFDQGKVPRDQIRVLYRSKTFPTTGFGVAYNLHPDLEQAIREAFFSFPWEGSVLDREFPDEDGFIPISYKEHWEVIRQIDQVFKPGYSCQ
ncbi:phosphate/phosphite/phosphonate ABC transporter substrate-binding protein [Lujinxingia sediminis]|uniref:Phosphate/phosphite/phosphonate ABC transporter substrate-binding protein n=1 Tax=Lujinxingia sediminis TaxID=2480984 RepID=A0ABY0CNG3_9DELT|nr:phosphate/phosphite/phosphonate ABC transporter substrate-binding protein [Lujinxingia sediminis]RVU41495.1 phosphate/phosphite/phosphonate ABC transporter substrate-binding protein [Lujinxingia sediminis]